MDPKLRQQIEPQPSALTLDLASSCSSLLQEPLIASDTPSCSLPQASFKIVQQWASGQGPSKRDPRQLLASLSELLLHEQLTLPIAIHFRPLIVDLTARILPTQGASWSEQRSRATFYALSKLLPAFPELYQIIREFLTILTARSDYLEAHLDSLSNDLPRLLLSIARLGLATPPLLHHVSHHASSTTLHSIFTDKGTWDAGTRLLAIQIFAVQEKLPEAVRKDLETQFVGAVPFAAGAAPQQFTPSQPDNATDAEIHVRSADGHIVESVDAWILPLEEKRRVKEICRRIHDRKQRRQSPDAEPMTVDTQPDAMHVLASDLHSNVKDVGGVLMLQTLPPRPQNQPVTQNLISPFILTPTVSPSINCLAQALLQRLPILLSGAPSCGKTTIIDHLASTLQPTQSSGESQVVTLQLGDHSSLDAKTLIGTYTSSTTDPGSFEWVEGALTKAVRTGKWLVLDDIDKATGEVLSVVKPLVEAMGPYKHLGALPELDLGTRGKIQAAPTFALFATRSVLPSQARNGKLAYSPPAFLGNNHWTEVTCSPVTEEDITLILAQSFPRLSKSGSRVLSVLISAWQALQQSSSSPAAKHTPAGSRRIPTLRDLIKWCRRIDTFLGDNGGVAILEDQRQLERAFIEGAEVFLGAVPPPTESPEAQGSSSKIGISFYKIQVDAFANALGLGADRAWWILHGRVPEIRGIGDAFESHSNQGQKVRVGRIDLPRQVQAGTSPISRNFAMTKPASLLLEQLAASTALAEPVLLVGETGTGKTTTVQHLASLLGRPMTALNLSQQTEASDILGSFKPLEPRIPATELHNTWSDLFERSFSAKRNPRFVELERKALRAGKWARLVQLWAESIRMADERRDRKLKQLERETSVVRGASVTTNGGASNKKRKTQRGSTPGSPSTDELEEEKALAELWKQFTEGVSSFSVQHASGKKNFVFSFVEGPLVKALREGSWVLLDEINLAASETLDSLASLLQSPESSITLFERGDVEPIPRHPNFRLFACMNPATDVGKKDLPANLRSRFTELYVQSPDADREALIAIVEKYIGHLAAGDRSVVLDVAESYAEIRRLSGQHLLADGANQRPHFSIRTLSRALTFAADQAATFGLRRALWEGFLMAFTLLLDDKSAATVRELLEQNIVSRARNAKQIMKFEPNAPKSNKEESFIKIGPFWLQSGPEPLEAADEYILTESVQAKLVGLARAILARKSPVLIQGPTSAGKTSAVEYLARRTGHRFVRINNHEHTDVQEYLGSYASDPDTGRLVFHEGLLVKALRRGDWIVLDELNLAPTDVLEALNRLLDDNRELIIPETGEVVKPHPSFMLFATQNPPGIYAGRKVLSRAFRNRFLELHFDDVPRAELEVILTHRCAMPPSYASKVVAVFVELQKRRQAGRVFDTKQAFVTLRDLFRWGQREAHNYQQLAENGYMLIAERARRSDDKAVVKEVLEEIMKVKINVDTLYDLRSSDLSAVVDRIGEKNLRSLLKASGANGLVWTSAMQRLLCLVAFALEYDEPVLLVGETGAGKTSVCETLATAFGSRLHTVNCHQNTDTADLLGGQRPLRNRGALQAKAKGRATAALQQYDSALVSGNEELDRLSSLLADHIPKVEAGSDLRAELQAAAQDINQATALFEWRDGPLVEAMRSGDHLLLDEISLADDSVLERLNSVLEPGRTLVLAERSGSSTQTDESLDAVQLKAREGFQVVATMNPGGDYGKKELSPALRNRFTEIYVPQVDERADILKIFDARWSSESLSSWGSQMLDFVDWFASEVGGKDQAGIGLRDLLSWVSFINTTVTTSTLSQEEAFAHGALLAFVDGIGALQATAAMTAGGLQSLRNKCREKIKLACGTTLSNETSQVVTSEAEFGIGPFVVKKGSARDAAGEVFSFQAPTTANNALKVLRALYVPNKAILLEGSPGAGKTSLIAAVAKASGNHLTRINLSDQTELVDLFGADLPVEGGGPGEFAWKDAAFLRAMQNGEWVLLDEMNLASQSVLEGLNSCLDHRGSVYIPELGRSFDKHPDFRLFAAQNPHQQGGGRKGLPKSFLNRFTKVFVDELVAGDILTICSHLYPQYNEEDLAKMIQFNALLHEEVMIKHSFGRQGAPWEFNLRDLMRWLVLIHADLGLNWKHKPIEHLGALYIQRFRTRADRVAAASLFTQCFDVDFDPFERPWPTLTPAHAQFGHVLLDRNLSVARDARPLALLQQHLPALEALADCVRLQWLSILAGPAGVGKSSLVRLLAQTMDPNRQARQALAVATASLEKFASQAATSDWFISWSTAQSLVHTASSAISVGSLHKGQLEGIADALERLSDTVSRESTDSNPLLQLLATFREIASQRVNAAGRFEWNDGPLLKAMREGSWLLLDDANLCSASVLDRLNSLFEPGGSLLLSERGIVDGEVPVIKPHPNFRLFMTIDPVHGELSRAMRNRGLEVSLSFENQGAKSSDADRIAGLNAFLDQHDLSVHLSPSESDLETCSRAMTVFESSTETPARHEFLFKTLPSHLYALASHVGHSDSREALLVLSAFSQRSGSSHQLARARDDWASSRQVDAAFVQGQGQDLSINPSMWDNESASTTVLRTAIELVSGSLALHQNLMSATEPKNTQGASKTGTLIQQSAAFNNSTDKGEEGSRETRLLFPLFQALGSSIVSQALKDENTQETVEVLSRLLSLARYLLAKCVEQVFDYSAVQVIVTDMRAVMNQLVSLSSGLDPKTAQLITAMHRQTTLTSGFAMQHIWRSSMSPCSFPEAYDVVSRLLHLLGRAKSARASAALLASAVDITATLTLPQKQWSQAHKDEILEMAEHVIAQLEKAVSSSIPPVKAAQPWEVPVFAVLQLCSRDLARSSNPTTTSGWYAEINKQIIESEQYPASRAIEIRQQSWSVRSDPNELALRHLHGSFAWASAMHSLSDGGELSKPFLLKAAAIPFASKRISLKDLREHRRQCARLARLASLSRAAVAPLRKTAIQSEIVEFAVILLSSLAPAAASILSRADDEQLRSALQEVKKILMQQSERAQDAMGAATSDLLVTVVQDTLVVVDGQDLAVTGQAFVSLASTFLKLYLPNIAIDPLAAMRTRNDFSVSRTVAIRQRLDVLIFFNSLTTGTQTSPAIRHLQQQLAEAEAVKPEIELAVKIERQTDVATLTRFFQDVLSFVHQILASSGIEDLSRHIRSLCDDRIVARENSLQHSLLNFKERLFSEYGVIRDLATPIALAMTMYQTGFRSMLTAQLQSQSTASNVKNAGIIDALTRFPTTDSTSAFTRLELPIKVKAGSAMGSQAVPMLLTVIAALHRDVKDGKPLPSVLRPLSRAYDQLFYIWSLDQEHERQEREEANSLFKSRGQDIEDLDDEKIVEAEFQKMFPEFADIMDANEAGEQTTHTNGKTPSRFFSADHVASLFALHLGLFDDDNRAKKAYTAQKKQLIQSLLKKSYDTLPEELDKVSASLQMTLLASEAGISPQESTANFYADPNVEETSKATSIVEDMRARLRELITEWPEQMVLQHIDDRCEAILRLDSQSPVAKILAALEQLLTHSEDWEGYANSSNSLASHRSRITAQIVEWRRLELGSWARLLETQSTAFATGVAEWWFRFYEVAIRGMQSALSQSDDKGSEHLRELTGLLDQYIRSSNIGEFEARLQLVRSFGFYVELLAEHAPGQETIGLERVAKVVHNASTFYDFYRPVVQLSLEKQRSKIEKEIRDFIQLASWRDVNIHALKQSAQRSHRKLHKCVRNFRDILRQPVDPILAAAADTKADDQLIATPSELARLPNLDTHVVQGWFQTQLQERNLEMPAHLQDLSRTFSVLRSMTDAKINPVLLDLHQDGLDGLATTIVSESEALAKATPALANEDNQKAVKDLTNRKRKAWTDLLREMKRIGLSPFVNAATISENCDAATVFSQPILRGAEVKSVQSYFYRVLKTLPKMRESLHAAQGDLPMAELQRGASYCEHAMSCVLKERHQVATLLTFGSSLRGLMHRLSVVQQGNCKLQPCHIGLAANVATIATAARRVASALGEICAEAPHHAQLSAFPSSDLAGLLDGLKTKQDQFALQGDQLERLSESLSSVHAVYWTEKEAQAVSDVLQAMVEMCEELKTHANSHAALEAMCCSTAEWISSTQAKLRDSFKKLRPAERPETPAHIAGDRLISSVLQVAQDLQKLQPSRGSSDEDELADKAIMGDLASTRAVRNALRITEIREQIDSFLEWQRGRTGDVLADEVGRVLPFVMKYADWVFAHLHAMLHWHKSLLKLTYCMANTVTSLATKGFCKPPEQDDAKDQGGGEDQELEGGTGLGDGSGAKDITDQMDEDENVEELQKNEDQDDEPTEGGETEREKGAREAEEDIDGNLEDVSADEDEDGASQHDDDEQQEIDDHVGDVDPLDPNAVDEKMWNGDQDENKKDEDKDQTDKDLGGQSGENEEAADQDASEANKDQDQEAAGDRKDKSEPEQGKDPKEAAEDGKEEQDGKDEDDKNEEGNEDAELQPEEDAGAEAEGQGRKLDEQAEAGDNLDIDDDLKMSDDEGGDDDMDGMSDMDLPDEPDADKHSEDATDWPEQENEELQKLPEGQDEQGVAQEETEEEVAKNKGEDAMDEDEDSSDAEEGADEQQAQNTRDGAQDTQDAEAGQDEIDANEPQGDSQPAGDMSSSAVQSQGTQGQQGRQSQAFDQNKQQGENQPADRADAESDANQQQSDEQTAADAGAAGGDDQQAAQDVGDNKEEDGSEPNPVRSLGDALKEFRRNIDAIAEASDQAEQQSKDDAKADGEGMPESADVEHIAEDQDAEMQALGAADQEDVDQKLPSQEALQDESKKGETKAPNAADEAEMPSDQNDAKLEPAPLPQFEEQESQRQTEGNMANGAQSKKALLPSDIQQEVDQQGIKGDDDDMMNADDVLDCEHEEDQVDPLPESERDEADHEVEEQLQDFRASSAEDRLSKAGDLWRSYSTLTSDLAFALCEQLRLILTPTLAARLNGDFRTGKRLNMRKIVPFIASDFAKDKIWLRRTKPSKREYQVLLALDDSRSMAESRSVHLAYQTLALVSGAMGRLEVGDVSICRFGETVQTLHPFGKGTFGDDSGAKVLEKLSFEQKGTNMVRLVEHTLKSLQEARNSRSSSSGSSAAELWQLQIIISDGVCQDHERLRSLLRRANEQRVMIVFIIVDSASQQVRGENSQSAKAAASNSILSMSSVRYETDPATGRMELKMDRYLDTFPFSHYVVLREAEALPEVLATTLRQWAEKIREAE
ncbi:unnamed protein product [Sympodiomycopsis kandeliae]